MTLSRKGFFSGLAAMASAIIAKAQNSGQAATIITPCRPKIQWGNQPSLCNGQCPQPDCGYRAPEFPKWPERLANGHQDWEAYDKLHTWPIGWMIRQFDPPGIDMYVTARLNRCPNCNTAFWQDPEPPAKEG